MALMPPMITRKKEVQARFDPDTFRIFGEVADLRQHRLSTLQQRGGDRYHTMPERAATSVTLPSEIAAYGLRNSDIDYRKNRPHPNNLNFLREDARLINEPICSVHTLSQYPTEAERVANEHPWWPNYREAIPKAKPPSTINTTVRKDFQYNKDLAPVKSTRHSSNPNFHQALGIVPVNTLMERDGSQRFFKERLSYENMYDCRRNSNYPIRAKRHGAYVYEQMKAADAKRYLQHPAFQALQTIWTKDSTHTMPSVDRKCETTTASNN